MSILPHELTESALHKLVAYETPTGIIYSISDLGDYIVEIYHQHQHNFIGSESEPTRYGNLADAKTAARSHGAVKLFLALSKTYEETESNKGSLVDQQHDKFDYMPLDP